MVGTTLNLDDLIVRDNLGADISNKYVTWENSRQVRKQLWEEVQRYLFQTDTSQTSNSSLPWKNKTTMPKLCQIRDNLLANYMATMFPKRRWLLWEGSDESSEEKSKKNAIRNYMSWVIDQREFKSEINKCILDYIDYGNCFGIPVWADDRVELQDGGQKVGYVGPRAKRISPMDIVLDPLAPSVESSPKIIRSFTNLGELKKQLVSMSTPEDLPELEELFKYLRDVRNTAAQLAGTIKYQDAVFNIAGFGSFQEYLGQDYVEVLTFMGDIYDVENDIFLENHKVMVVDRHKVIYKKPNPSYFGRAPIYHAGWRIRQDNIWAMGPLDNLVGLQYRIDHLENMKADIWDLTAFPVFKIKGMVDDFRWGPLARIYCGDEGDVEIMSPNVNALAANLEIQEIERKMEEMAGAPKEAMGMRTPGEKTMYEVQSMENAASRIFQNKIAQFEEQFLEPFLNGLLEQARRKMNNTMVRIFDDEFGFATFETLTPEDITGAGRIKPVAARHFAERAQLVQNLNTFRNSAAGQDQMVMNHFSALQEARMWEEILDIEDWKLVQENIRITEQADAQKMANVASEKVAMEAGTPSGLSEDDIG